jgi:hypothetical protein
MTTPRMDGKMGSSSRARNAHWFIKAFGKEMAAEYAVKFPRNIKAKQYLGYDEMNCDVRMFVDLKLKGGRETLMQDWIVLDCTEVDLERVIELARGVKVPDKEIRRRIMKYGEFTKEDLDGLFEDDEPVNAAPAGGAADQQKGPEKG